jgi:hypothetical protein
MFDKYVDSNIDMAFPRTRALKIENCYFSFNNVHLPSFDLLELEVARRASFCSNHMVVKTSKDDSQATYTVGYPTSNHQDLFGVELLCGS